MNNGMKILVVLLVGGVLAGCQSVTDFYGKGPLNVTSRIQAGFEKYKSGPGPEYFAVAQDGSSYGWSYCVGGIDNCRGGGLPGSIAINACERNSNGVPCRIYARSRRVVWDTSVLAPEGSASPLAGKSVDVICGYAVDYSGDQPAWVSEGELVAYAQEAKNRKISLEECDAMN